MTEINQDWEQFKQKFHAKSGINLNDYKPAQMQRRITNLMGRRGLNKYMDFFRLIDTNQAAYNEFIDFMTINVTEFFRTPEKFVELEKKVIPDLLKTSDSLTIWSAGCSTGAEPYTLAIIMNEISPNNRHKIIASDLDAEMLAKAKRGNYTLSELKNIAPERLAKHFKKEDNNTYTVAPKLQQMITFKKQNLLTDKFDTNIDLILCRNVVIYFTEEAKNILYKRFLEALKPSGILFVGGTEAILNFRELGYKSYMPFFYQKP